MDAVTARVCSTVMNSVRTDKKQKVWKPSDFMIQKAEEAPKRKLKPGELDPVFSRLDAHASLSRRRGKAKTTR
jgi:hypothetical protein